MDTFHAEGIIHIEDCQTVINLDKDFLEKLQSRSLVALDKVKHRVSNQPDLDIFQTKQFEVSLVDNLKITEIHKTFLNNPTPTDVITFQHGELIISIETAQNQGLLYEQSLENEVFRYVVHGWLHLAGFQDKNVACREEMMKIQESIINEILEEESQKKGYSD